MCRGSPQTIMQICQKSLPTKPKTSRARLPTRRVPRQMEMARPFLVLFHLGIAWNRLKKYGLSSNAEE